MKSETKLELKRIIESMAEDIAMWKPDADIKNNYGMLFHNVVNTMEYYIHKLSRIIDTENANDNA